MINLPETEFANYPRVVPTELVGRVVVAVVIVERVMAVVWSHRIGAGYDCRN